MNIFFKIIDSRLSFYCNNLDLLPPKPTFTFRNLKTEVQGTGSLFLAYINNLKQELGTAKTYEHNLFDEKSVVDRCHMAAEFSVFFDEDHSMFPTLYLLPNLY